MFEIQQGTSSQTTKSILVVFLNARIQPELTRWRGGFDIQSIYNYTPYFSGEENNTKAYKQTLKKWVNGVLIFIND